MVLCVLQNQPMELGASIMSQTQSNRKRKRKPSGPKRRPMVIDEVTVEPIDYSSPCSPQKHMKIEHDNSGTNGGSTDDEKIENSRVPSYPDASAASPTPLSDKNDCSDDWKGNDIEVVKLEKVVSSDDEDDLGPNVPQILRNQAKSLRLAKARAAAMANSPAPSASSSLSPQSSDKKLDPSPQRARSTGGGSSGSNHGDDSNRYYKNMSRERRLIANARERTRVHTISTAFDALRQAIPTYSYNQKLSKLAILRIASAYIKSLSALNGDPVGNSFGQCVTECTKTLQMECRARSRRKGRSKD